MTLDYLLFDFSDEESGRGSFDAMASVQPGRWPDLLGEVEAVLRWAAGAFGAPAALGDDGDWDYELQAGEEGGRALPLVFDARKRTLQAGSPGPASLSTLTLTLSGSPAFCDALREAFGAGD